MSRPSCAVTFADGCVLTYSHPDGDKFPRADMTMVPGHMHDVPDDARIGQAVGRAFLDATVTPPEDDPTITEEHVTTENRP